MPLDVFFDDHHLSFFTDDHAVADPTALSAWPVPVHHLGTYPPLRSAFAQHAELHKAWPLHHKGAFPPLRTALAADGEVDKALKAAEEEASKRSIMQITKVAMPPKATIDEMGQACKLDKFTSVFGDASGSGAAKPGSNLGNAIESSSGCVDSVSAILTKIFGHKLDSPTDPVGIDVTNNHDLPGGSMLKQQFKSTQDSCHEFASFLLQRFPKVDGAEAPKFKSDDATHALRSYGLCLDNIGQSASLEGCEMGDLQKPGFMGNSAAADVCRHIQGPIPKQSSSWW